MVKAKLRKKAERAERASKSATTVARDAGEVAAAEDDVEDAMANLTSHHRRKVKKRAVFLEKIRVATETKMKRESSKKSKGLKTDMKTLSLSLADIVANGGKSPGKLGKSLKTRTKTAKARTALVRDETTRMQHVLAHPQFKSNPIAAISNHIVTGVRDAFGAEASGVKDKTKLKVKKPKKQTPAQQREQSAAHAVGVSQTNNASRSLKAHKHGGGTSRGKMLKVERGGGIDKSKKKRR